MDCSSSIVRSIESGANLLIGCVMLVLFVVTSGIHIPRRREWRQFRMAVHLVGLACLLLAVDYIVSIFYETPYFSALSEQAPTAAASHSVVSLITVVGAMFQAMLFTMTSVVLVIPDAVRWPQVARHLAVLAAITLLCVGSYIVYPDLHEAFVVVMCISYSAYMTYLTIFFLRSFNLAVSYLETVYDDDMMPRLRWVRVFFFGAFFVGLLALATAVFPCIEIYTLFNASVPVYYCFAVVRLMNYVVTSAFVVKVPAPAESPAPLHASYSAPDYGLSKNVDERSASEFDLSKNADTSADAPVDENAERFAAVRQALDEWIEARGYAQGDVTVEEIIDVLGVSRQDFMAYFKDVLGTQFRTWRRHIRIEAAMRLVDADPDVCVSEIIESVGYSDRSNFHKHFQSLAGISLKEYRAAALKPDGNEKTGQER